ncbi:MAG: hypothetical protein ACHREM_18700 [Polyangiales bacterium]
MGYAAAKIAPVIAGTTIDDGPPAVQKSFPGVVLRLLGDMEAQLPLTGAKLVELDVDWVNAQAGAIRSVRARAPDGGLDGHLALARCLGGSLHAEVEIRETDHAKKTTAESFTTLGLRINVDTHGINAFASGQSMPAASVSALLVAIDGCQ